MTEATTEDLSYDECLRRLRDSTVGRVAVVVDDAPIVLPINYRLVETVGLTLLAVRTRPGNVIESGGLQVAFEIDQFDPLRQEGWSVLVRGTLHHVDPLAADFKNCFDPHPWLVAERDAWLIIQPFAITGRQLTRSTREWAFHIRGYL
jgi:nitroimidazol reductase NimA-like FMN-containing flavoprotein (pyridoxamine 5'-phosphate oxidase superfamily)